MVSVKEAEKEIYYDAYKNFAQQKDDVFLSPTRYQKISARENRSDQDIPCLTNLCAGKYKLVWRGIPMMKHSIDLILSEQLLWYVKPRTIFEIGCYTGASALWLSDTMKKYEVDTHVYTLDLDTSLVNPLTKNNKNITVIEDDVGNISNIFPEEKLKSLPHPWYISEDCHFHVMNTLEYFHQYMQEGDYFVIDDTSPDMPSYRPDTLVFDGEWAKLGKLEVLRDFLKKYEEYYRIDSYYTDMFGYNGTMNWNGYVKRIK